MRPCRWRRSTGRSDDGGISSSSSSGSGGRRPRWGRCLPGEGGYCGALRADPEREGAVAPPSARDERIDRCDAINIIGDGEEGASRESIRIRDESSGRRIMALVSCGWTGRPGPFSLPISLNAVQQLSRRVDLCARRRPSLDDALGGEMEIVGQEERRAGVSCVAFWSSRRVRHRAGFAQHRAAFHTKKTTAPKSAGGLRWHCGRSRGGCGCVAGRISTRTHPRPARRTSFVAAVLRSLVMRRDQKTKRAVRVGGCCLDGGRQGAISRLPPDGRRLVSHDRRPPSHPLGRLFQPSQSSIIQRRCNRRIELWGLGRLISIHRSQTANVWRAHASLVPFNRPTDQAAIPFFSASFVRCDCFGPRRRPGFHCPLGGNPRRSFRLLNGMCAARTALAAGVVRAKLSRRDEGAGGAK
uniref:Uncharacterized protein n=1 Tax=Plectus sambesii TaxID=2011161 RepID=A0A914UU86_9BILA